MYTEFIIVGDSGMGKTNLLSRFVKNEIDMNSQSTTCAYQTKL